MNFSLLKIARFTPSEAVKSMGRPDFDKPTKNSLLEAKEYWEEHKQFQKEMMNDPENMSNPDYDKEHYLQDI